MPANSEVLKMLLDEESGRMPAFGGVAAMSELQEDRTAQSNSGFTKTKPSLVLFFLHNPTTHPPLLYYRVTKQDLNPDFLLKSLL